MTLIEAAKQAREAMKYATAPNEVFDFLKADEMLEQALAALDQVIAEAEQQEPEAWMQESTGVIRCDWGFDKTGYVPLYTTPPKREWQGLTTDDIKGLCANNIPSTWDIGLCRLVEKFLKEKNT